MLFWLRLSIVGVAFITTVVNASGGGQSSPVVLSGTFSSVCKHSETGDVLGTEISFIPVPRGLSLLIQRFEGQPLVPVLLFVTMPRNGRIEVRASEDGGVSFVADVRSESQIRLQFIDGQVSRTGSSEETLFRRVPSWIGDWKQIPVCK